jgi:hypothetical protein
MHRLTKRQAALSAPLSPRRVQLGCNTYPQLGSTQVVLDNFTGRPPSQRQCNDDVTISEDRQGPVYNCRFQPRWDRIGFRLLFLS